MTPGVYIALAKRFWWAVPVAGLLGAAVVQSYRLNTAQADLVKEKGERAIETRQRVEAAAKHEDELAALKDTHRNQTKEKEDDFTKTKAALVADAVARAADARGLRDKLAAATRRSGPDQAGPIACERQGDRLEALGTLAGEGVELAEEGRSLLKQRDLEVVRLLDQIRIDRTACSPAS